MRKKIESEHTVALSESDLESIKSLVAHESAHAFVSLKLGIPLMKINLKI